MHHSYDNQSKSQDPAQARFEASIDLVHSDQQTHESALHSSIKPQSYTKKHSKPHALADPYNKFKVNRHTPAQYNRADRSGDESGSEDDWEAVRRKIKARDPTIQGKSPASFNRVQNLQDSGSDEDSDEWSKSRSRAKDVHETMEDRKMKRLQHEAELVKQNFREKENIELQERAERRKRFAKTLKRREIEKQYEEKDEKEQQRIEELEKVINAASRDLETVFVPPLPKPITTHESESLDPKVNVSQSTQISSSAANPAKRSGILSMLRLEDTIDALSVEKSSNSARNQEDLEKSKNQPEILGNVTETKSSMRNMATETNRHYSDSIDGSLKKQVNSITPADTSNNDSYDVQKQTATRIQEFILDNKLVFTLYKFESLK